VLLLDEPLGALDLKLRKQMQLELKRIQRDVGITFLYVTHDQEEAMVMSDRLAVMNAGRIEQVGSPEDVYERPTTEFVASFLGASNLIPGQVADHEQNGYAVVALVGGTKVLVPKDRIRSGHGAVKVGVRPEKLHLEAGDAPAHGGGGVNAITGRVVSASYLGVSHQYTVEGPGGSIVTVYVQNLGRNPSPVLGETVRLAWQPDHTFIV
jgi:spermidine/putrescine transport system ATP-binding protein